MKTKSHSLKKEREAVKLSEDVTRDMLANVVENALADMDQYRRDARAAYEADKSDEFHKYMDTMFALAGDMVRSRLSTLCDND